MPPCGAVRYNRSVPGEDTEMPAAKVSRHETRKIVRPLPVAPPRPIETIQDELAVEDPLEIRVNGQPLTVLLRTPGDDYDLAAGFFLSRGVVRSERDFTSIRHFPNSEAPEGQNVVNVIFPNSFKWDAHRLQRNLFACELTVVSARAALDRIKSEFKSPPNCRVRIDVLYNLVHTMRKARSHLHQNGGLHAAAIFDAKGVLHMLREDVERLNAVDKSVGAMLLQERLPLDNHILLASGRASFDVILKAVRIGIPVVCSINAPSSLAVELARETGVTLICFLPGDEINVYTHAERIEV